MIEKFVEVVPGLLYRGGKPETYQDLLELKEKYNIKQIICLDLKAYKHIQNICPTDIIAHSYPLLEYQKDNVDIILQKIDSISVSKIINNIPTFVHCKYGKDRTGAFIARYRVENGWQFSEAIKEAMDIGFGLGLSDFELDLFLKFIDNGYKEMEKNKL